MSVCYSTAKTKPIALAVGEEVLVKSSKIEGNRTRTIHQLPSSATETHGIRHVLVNSTIQDLKAASSKRMTNALWISSFCESLESIACMVSEKINGSFNVQDSIISKLPPFASVDAFREHTPGLSLIAHVKEPSYYAESLHEIIEILSHALDVGADIVDVYASTMSSSWSEQKEINSVLDGLHSRMSLLAWLEQELQIKTTGLSAISGRSTLVMTITRLLTTLGASSLNNRRPRLHPKLLQFVIHLKHQPFPRGMFPVLLRECSALKVSSPSSMRSSE